MIRIPDRAIESLANRVMRCETYLQRVKNSKVSTAIRTGFGLAIPIVRFEIAALHLVPRKTSEIDIHHHRGGSRWLKCCFQSDLWQKSGAPQTQIQQRQIQHTILGPPTEGFLAVGFKGKKGLLSFLFSRRDTRQATGDWPFNNDLFERAIRLGSKRSC